jgi:hypothetical protein
MPTYCGDLTHVAVNNAFDTWHLGGLACEVGALGVQPGRSTESLSGARAVDYSHARGSRSQETRPHQQERIQPGNTRPTRPIRAFAKSTIRQISGFDLTGHPGDAKGGTFVPSAGARACETMQMAALEA